MRWPSTQTLTREGRDTLWLLAVLAFTLAPHTTRLPWWCSFGTALAIAWRAWIALKDSVMPPRWLVFLVLVASLAATWVTFHTLMGRAAGITLVTLLAGLKTLELRAKRDAFVITALGFFLILTQFLHDQGPLTALMMSFSLWGLLSTLVLAQRPLGRPTLRSALKESGRALLWGLPLAAMLYFFFPRFGPLWTLPGDAQAKTGLSDRIELGQLAKLAQDDTVALRVRFDGEPPSPAQRYFRGPVLDIFNGEDWQSMPPESPPHRTLTMASAQERKTTSTYQLTVESLATAELPLLDGTDRIDTIRPSTYLVKPDDMGWRVGRVEKQRLEVQAHWQPQWKPLISDSDPLLNWWRQLPIGHALGTIRWAKDQTQTTGWANLGNLAKAQKVLQYIRTAGFSYTLAPEDNPEPSTQTTSSTDPTDQFWLHRKSGFCEHFATAFVVVMRAQGVPARVVTGYQGAELNPFDGYYVVRNSDAHAWAEIWVAGQGWVRIDPTGAIAPDRIERPRNISTPATSAFAAITQNGADWLKKTRAALDAARFQWSVWVEGYNRDKQFSILKNWGWPDVDVFALARISGLGLTGAAILGFLFAGIAQRPRDLDNEWIKAWTATHQVLVKYGWPRPSTPNALAGPLAWASSIESQTTPLARALAIQLRELDQIRYGEHWDVNKARRLVRRIRQMAQQRPSPTRPSAR